jgi:aldehyde:ferredoxin oxidoreductase
MYGWTGKILKVDLTDGMIWHEPLNPDLLAAYFGGRGLGVRLMRSHFQLDPFDPQMPLIFAVGPLCGTSVPASSRMSVVSRSPLTGTIFDSSAGGKFPQSIKAAGFDALYITGKSRVPVVLKITPDRQEIQEATALWGKTVRETVSTLSGYGRVAAIGPAGENRVLYADIIMDGIRAAGRGGLGAVMGSKGLKAMVIDGDLEVAVADGKRLQKARENVMRLFHASPSIFGDSGIIRLGTPAFVDLIAKKRMTPTENFRKTFFPYSGNYSGSAIRKAYGIVAESCSDCPLACKKMTMEGTVLPEYDTVSHFGALNSNIDLGTIMKANALCNNLGMDAISGAATLATWGEYRGSFLSRLELLAFLLDIAHRRGVGDLLAEGSRRAAETLGRPELSMSVKSLELPAYDPRGMYGTAMAYCTSNRGGCHLSAIATSHEILRHPVQTDRFSFSGKAKVNVAAEDTYAVADSLAVCRYAFLGATLEEYADMFNATSGFNATAEELLKIGAGIHKTERFYNVVNGFDRRQDQLPQRFYCESGTSDGGIEIPPIDRSGFDEELQNYYRIRGLTSQGTFVDTDFLAKQP